MNWVYCTNSTFYCDRLFDNLELDKSNGVLRLSLMHYNGFDEGNKIIDYFDFLKNMKVIFNILLIQNKNAVTKSLKNSFNLLSKDKYYTNNRLRSYSLLKVDVIDNIEIIGDLNFYQSNDYNTYNGNNLRNYENIDSSILKDPCFKYLTQYFIYNVYKNNPNINTKYIQVHQIRVYAEKEKTNLVPEGIHQDGYNMIAIACITRKNIKGGINLIYDSSKNLIHNLQLGEGEIIILNDNKLYHDVLPIELYKENEDGYRDILVFTTIS